MEILLRPLANFWKCFKSWVVPKCKFVFPFYVGCFCFFFCFCTFSNAEKISKCFIESQIYVYLKDILPLMQIMVTEYGKFRIESWSERTGLVMYGVLLWYFTGLASEVVIRTKRTKTAREKKLGLAEPNNQKKNNQKKNNQNKKQEFRYFVCVSVCLWLCHVNTNIVWIDYQMTLVNVPCTMMMQKR